MQVGCKHDLTGGKIKYDAQTGNVVGRVDVLQGYTENYCMSCSTNDQTVKRDNMIFKQAVPLELSTVITVLIIFALVGFALCYKSHHDIELEKNAAR